MSKQKIIITIEDDIEPELAVRMVEQVIEGGKVSEDMKGRKFYCWGTLFKTTHCAAVEDKKIFVGTRHTRNENTASFVVQKYEYEV